MGRLTAVKEDAGVMKETTDKVRGAFSSVETAALAGVVCAVQLGLSYYLFQRQPGASSSDAELAVWFGDAGNRRAVLVALNLTPVGAIFAAAVVLFVTGSFSGPLAFLFPAWLLVVSVTLLLTRRILDRDASSTIPEPARRR
jgi:hypothetical protein